MSLTVEQVLQMEQFKDARLVGGKQGVSRIIRIPNIVETPEVAQWMKGGELLITSGYIFKDSPQLVRSMIYDLSAKDISALGLRGGKYFTEATPEMISACNEVNLPLIELPPNISYMDLMMPIFETVINNQLSLLRKSQEIHDSLIKIVLSGKGLSGICQALTKLIECPVVLLNERGSILAKSEYLDYSIEENLITDYFIENKQYINQLQRHKATKIGITTDDIQNYQDYFFFVPINISNMTSGYIIAKYITKPSDEDTIMALEHASTFFALEIMKMNTRIETEKQIRGELLDYLLFGNLDNLEEISHWAVNLDFDLKKKSVIFYISLDNSEVHHFRLNRVNNGYMDLFKSHIYQAARSSFINYPGGILMLTRRDYLVGYVNVDTQKPDSMNLLDETLLGLLKEVNRKIEVTGSISIGVGKVANDIADVKKSYQEAKIAHRIGALVQGTGSLSYYEKLNSYEVLHELNGATSSKKIVELVLGPIIEYDESNRTQLLHTLYTYFENDCNVRKTATALFVHRNTVNYRLKQIEELSRKLLNKSMDRFDLLLCLKILKVNC